MPDASGKLTAEEKSKVQGWLGRHGWPNNLRGLCPICGKGGWVIAEHLVQPMSLGGNRALNIGGIGYPQVMVISESCGYTMYFNAVLIGLEKPNEPAQSDG
jgi:hypothetical protein